MIHKIHKYKNGSSRNDQLNIGSLKTSQFLLIVNNEYGFYLISPVCLIIWFFERM